MNVGEGSHPERVKVYGPGVEKTGLKANEPTYFTVDCSEAGQGAQLPWGCVLGGEGSDPPEPVTWCNSRRLQCEAPLSLTAPALPPSQAM